LVVDQGQPLQVFWVNRGGYLWKDTKKNQRIDVTIQLKHALGGPVWGQIFETFDKQVSKAIRLIHRCWISIRFRL